MSRLINFETSEAIPFSRYRTYVGAHEKCATENVRSGPRQVALVAKASHEAVSKFISRLATQARSRTVRNPTVGQTGRTLLSPWYGIVQERYWLRWASAVYCC